MEVDETLQTPVLDSRERMLSDFLNFIEIANIKRIIQIPNLYPPESASATIEFLRFVVLTKSQPKETHDALVEDISRYNNIKSRISISKFFGFGFPFTLCNAMIYPLFYYRRNKRMTAPVKMVWFWLGLMFPASNYGIFSRVISKQDCEQSNVLIEGYKQSISDSRTYRELYEEYISKHKLQLIN